MPKVKPIITIQLSKDEAWAVLRAIENADPNSPHPTDKLDCVKAKWFHTRLFKAAEALNAELAAAGPNPEPPEYVTTRRGKLHRVK